LVAPFDGMVNSLIGSQPAASSPSKTLRFRSTAVMAKRMVNGQGRTAGQGSPGADRKGWPLGLMKREGQR
jgi:hypothetical protein